MNCTVCDGCNGATYDICIVRHAAYGQTFTLLSGGNPIDLAGATIEMYIKPISGSLVTLSTGGGGIIIGFPTTNGSFTTNMDPAATYALAAGQGSYELFVNDNRILSGAVCVQDTIWVSP